MLSVIKDILRQWVCEPPTLEDYDQYVRDKVRIDKRYEIDWVNLKIFLENNFGIEAMSEFRPDTKKYFVDENTLKQMTPYLTYPADDYIYDYYIDCDDYAQWATADARRIFRVNGIFECWGNLKLYDNSPPGAHAFCLAITSYATVKLFEPNAGFPWAGELFNIGEHGYTPLYWK